jgi:ribosomal protein S18 acetylase RimI-like enzyme
MSFQPEQVLTLRPIRDDDLGFLYLLYASTRAQEQALFGMSDEQWHGFLRMQFDLQHAQYMRNYQNPSFDIIMLGNSPVGRLYVDRCPGEIRIIDISLLPDYRGRGIGAGLMRKILGEGDDRGIPATLHVEKNNSALALYQRLGFRIEGDRGVSWFMERSPSNVAAPVFEPRVAADHAWPGNRLFPGERG